MSDNKWAVYRFACDLAESEGNPSPTPPLEPDGLVDFTRLTSPERLAYLTGWERAAVGIVRPDPPAHLAACFALGVRECRRINQLAAP
jgi:hypothetical protein